MGYAASCERFLAAGSLLGVRCSRSCIWSTQIYTRDIVDTYWYIQVDQARNGSKIQCIPPLPIPPLFWTQFTHPVQLATAGWWWWWWNEQGDSMTYPECKRDDNKWFSNWIIPPNNPIWLVYMIWLEWIPFDSRFYPVGLPYFIFSWFWEISFTY